MIEQEDPCLLEASAVFQQQELVEDGRGDQRRITVSVDQAETFLQRLAGLVRVSLVIKIEPW
jgi:hypothetical protein